MSPERIALAGDEPPPEEFWDEDVAEVAGAPFTGIETASAISIGVLALLGSGLLGLVLSALAEEHRLSVAGIGQTATLEALSMGLATGLSGIFLKPKRLKLMAVAAALLLVAADLGTLRASGVGLMAIRTLAGLPEGLLLWITVGLISRTVTPERWAGALFTGMGLTQVCTAAALTAWGLPRFGANSGYMALAGAAGLCVPLAVLLPRSYGPTPGTDPEASGAPPLRGWVALAGTLSFTAALAAVAVYVIPLARETGLGVGVGRLAVSVGLACQILGGALATGLAGRVRYITVFSACTAAFAVTWTAYALHSPAWLFVAVSGLGGLAAMLAGPFLVPMTIEADPTRRAAMQSGTVQVLAGALGPFLASLAVGGGDVRGVLVLAAGLLVAGMAVVTGLHRLAHADLKRASAPPGASGPLA